MYYMNIGYISNTSMYIINTKCNTVSILIIYIISIYI